jgi:uncharacterized protein YqiB (DUF1249 family)
MISDSVVSLTRVTRPGSFAALMTLYESNYIRLSWLVPDLTGLAQSAVSDVSGDLPLYLTRLERSRYTTTACLTYYFDDAGERIADPDLRIRIYHDARLVEAMACTHHHRHEALRRLDPGPGGELSRRWVRNVMLNKWLEYCSDQGHRFAEHRPTLHAVANP